MCVTGCKGDVGWPKRSKFGPETVSFDIKVEILSKKSKFGPKFWYFELKIQKFGSKFEILAEYLKFLTYNLKFRWILQNLD